MKKLFALIISSMLIFGASCSKNNDDSSKTQRDTSSQVDFDELELIRWDADRNICYTYEQLEKDSELIVIGTVIDDMETEYTMGTVAGISGEVLEFISSSNTVRIDKVLKGNISVDDEITVGQSCGPYKDQFVTFSDMKPLIKGDQWIFCLRYIESSEKYFCVGDYTSRFPVPETQTATLSRTVTADSKAQLEGEIEKMTNEDFGVYDGVSPMRELYYDVITHYDCTLQ